MSIFASDFGTWRAQSRKYRAITRINMQNSLAYIWDAFSQTFFVALFVYVLGQLWTATFAAQDATLIAGLTLNQTIWYFVWAELVQLSKINPVGTIQEEVKDGSLAYTLGRPYNYVLYHFFRGLGGVAVRMTTILLVGSLVAYAQAGTLSSFRFETFPLVLFVTFLAFILDYCIAAMIGLLAFFFEDVMSFRLIYHKILFVIGGLFIPIDFLPGGIQGVVRVLPFNLVLYGPAKLFVDWDGAQFVQVVALQIVWIAILGSCLALLYKYGTQRVSINGG